MRRSVLVGLAVGLVGGALALVVILRHDGHPDAAPAFLDAWRRSLTATYVITERIERTLVDGRHLVTEATEVQRPPDRLRVAAGHVDGRLAGRLVGCVVGTGVGATCRDGGPAPPFDRDVSAALGDVRALVSGSRAPYRVRRGRDAGCFVLVLRARILSPPYGEDATFCFDARTGAPARAIVHRAEGTDVHTTLSVRAEVDESDLRLPAHPSG